MGSWKIGRIAGIEVSLHWTLLVSLVLAGLQAPLGSSGAYMLLAAAVMGCILLHELGHALAARQFGIRTEGIMLCMIGGIASLERIPRRPQHELWIAIAGPLVNVAIALAIWLTLPLLAAIVPSATPWFLTLLLVNLGLVLFNLLPAFPMDGGRILRALLAFRHPYARATEMATHVGRIVALALGGLGLITFQLNLTLVALFVLLAGRAESYHVYETMASEEPPKSRQEGPLGGTQAGRRWVFRAPSNAPAGTYVIWDSQLRRYRTLRT